MAKKKEAELPEIVTRAFALPVHHADNEEFWPLIRRCWKEATLLSNFVTHQLLKNDCVRTPGSTWEQMKNYTPPDVYALVFGRKKEKAGRKYKEKILPVVASQYDGVGFFAGATVSANQIIQQVIKKYKSERYDILWNRSRSPATYLSPQPWPVTKQQWKEAWLDESGKPCIRFALPMGKGDVTLRLRGGAEFKRQMAIFRQIADGAPKIALSIQFQRCSESCHRPTLTLNGVPGRVMVKMVADVPVQKSPGKRTLTLITDPKAFWVAELDGRQAWVLNADHLKRAYDWMEVHTARSQRIRQDCKAERRLDPKKEKQWLRSFKKACEKQNNRMSSWLHESAAHLTGFCVRNNVGFVLYRDLDQGFIPSFPWFPLKTLLRDKLTAAGIHLQCASDEVADLSGLTPEGEKECLESMKQNVKATRRLTKAALRCKSHPEVCPPSKT